MSNDNRHPAGTSLGGQWAPGSASEIEADEDFPTSPLLDDISDDQVRSLARNFPDDDLYAYASDVSESESFDFDEAKEASIEFSDQMSSLALTHRDIDKDSYDKSLADYKQARESVSDYDFDAQAVVKNQRDAADRIHERLFGDSGDILARERKASSRAMKRLLDEDGESGVDQALNGELSDDDAALVSENIADSAARAQDIHRRNDPYGAERFKSFYAKAKTGNQGIATQAKSYRILKNTLERISR